MNRVIRTTMYSLIYIAICVLFMRLLGFPKVPARGDWAFGCDAFFLWFGILSSVGLVMYVYDATSLHCDFIRLLNLGPSDWPAKAVEKFSCSPFLGGSVREYIDIRVIADRSDLVGRLIYYPFIVVLLMVAARTAYFDDWTWPPGLVLIFTANLVVAIYNSLRLYSWATHSKSRALEVLKADRHALIASGVDEKSLRVFGEIIKEVDGMTQGAFAPFWEQPVVRAILYSSGGLGLGSILQTIPQFF